MRICSMGPGDYDKEIPWHWNDGTNGVLAPLSGMALVACG